MPDGYIFNEIVPFDEVVDRETKGLQDASDPVKHIKRERYVQEYVNAFLNTAGID